MLNVEIEETGSVMIDDYDLCRMLSNIIDNAVNAAMMLESDKEAKITIVIDHESVNIKSKNDFVPEQKKETADGHGFGRKIIQDIAKKYNGKYSFYLVNNTYYSDTTVSNISIE